MAVIAGSVDFTGNHGLLLGRGPNEDGAWHLSAINTPKPDRGLYWVEPAERQ